jgi:hypothetical protein
MKTRKPHREREERAAQRNRSKAPSQQPGAIGSQPVTLASKEPPTLPGFKPLFAKWPSKTNSHQRGTQETLIHVYWTGINDSDDKGKGHLAQRGKVSADLGLEAVPVPGFTSEEMQQITFAAKMAAIKCLQDRKK